MAFSQLVDEAVEAVTVITGPGRFLGGKKPKSVANIFLQYCNFNANFNDFSGFLVPVSLRIDFKEHTVKKTRRNFLFQVHKEVLLE